MDEVKNKYKTNWQRHKILNARKHQFDIFEKLNNLTVSRRNGKTITIEGTGEQLIEFASCSYLGLDQDKRVTDSVNMNAERFGINFAVARTRLRTRNHDELESLLSPIFCGAAITLFSSLHLTHLGFFPLLGSGELPSFPLTAEGPLFIMDKAAHNCMQVNRALLSQFGEVTIVDFQEPESLIKTFKAAKTKGQTPISISDSICSMGGIVPIKLLLSLAEENEGYVYLDDAHGTSIYGKNGCGYVLDLLEGQFHPRMVLTPSLSKGFGSNIGVLALPTKADMDMVRRFASPYLFSNPPVSAAIDAAIASAKIHLTDEIYSLQKKLWDNVAFFDRHIQHETINKDVRVPMRGVKIGDEQTAIACAVYLREQGFFTTAAMYPTVALGKAIIRVALSALHTQAEIKSLCDHLNYFLSQRRHVQANDPQLQEQYNNTAL